MIGDTKEELKKIKKLYGEEFSHFCNSELAIVLDNHDVLFKILKENFAPNKFLLDDIKKQDKVKEFVSFILFKFRELVPEKIKKAEKTILSPEELMLKNGYTLTKVEDFQQFDSFRKYYFYGEVPCSFNVILSRLQEYNVFFAVSDEANKFDRFSFTNPSREDEYSLSVLLILFSKPENDIDCPTIKHIVSRYNHVVENPNATLGLDLNLLAPGLVSAFENYYGYSCKPNAKKEFSLNGYVKFEDKFYKSNVSINNIHYCSNNVVISGKKCRTLDKEKYVLIDYFLVDLEHKQLKFLDNSIDDSICERFKNIVNIIVSKKGQNGNKKITFKFLDKPDIELNIDGNNSLIGYSDYTFDKIDDNFLLYAKNIQYVYLLNSQGIGNQCFSNSTKLEVLDIPHVVEIGNYCFLKTNMKNLICNNLKYIGEYSFIEDKNVEILDLPNLVCVGDFAFKFYPELKVANLSSVKNLGKYCFSSVENLTDVRLDSLINMGEHCFNYATALSNFIAPHLAGVKEGCFKNVGGMEICYIPNVKTIGDGSFYFVRNLKLLKANCLEFVGSGCFEHSYNLEKFFAPNLKVIGKNSFLMTYKLNSEVIDFIDSKRECFKQIKQENE